MSRPPPSSSSSLVSSLMALQLLSRGATFLLNQALFRLASPAAFGAASIQLELLLGTILFLSREGVRGALLRRPSVPTTPKDKNQTDDDENDTTIARTNIALLPLLAGIPLALLTALLYTTYSAGHEIRAQPHFHATVVLYAAAAVVELLSEPFYNVAMTELQTGIRVRAEGLAISAKSVTTFLVLLYDSRSSHTNAGNLALLAFAFGQLAYALVLLAVYALYLGPARLLPRKPASVSASSGSSLLRYIDRDTLHLSYTMTLQSLVKHVLTEGDKLVLSYFSPLQDQGGYAIAVNYGSLIARIVFQPIEESLRVLFSRTLSSSFPSSLSPTSLLSAASTLHTLLALQLSLSPLFLLFAHTYAPLLLPLLLPPAYRATSALSVLGAWVWYVPVLAVNGGLEAFLASVASARDLNQQSRWMVAFSALYILSAIAFYRAGFGDAALVYANILTLSARIAYALRFVSRFFNSRSGSPAEGSASGSSLKPEKEITTKLFDWRRTLPPRSLLTSLSLSLLLIKLSARHFKIPILTAHVEQGEAQSRLAPLLRPAILAHIGLGACLGALCLLVWWRTAGRYLVVEFADARKGKGKAKAA